MSSPPPSGPQPYQAYPSGRATGPARLRGRTPLLLSLIFGVVGIALLVIGIVVVAKDTLNKIDKFQRVQLSSTGSVTLNSGNHVAYYESRTVNDNTDTVPLIPIALRSPSGTVTRITTPYGGRSDNKVKILRYDYNGHHGIALYQFKIAEKGTYTALVGSNTQAAPDGQIAFGTSIAKGEAIGAALIVPGILLIITAIILLIVGLVKRSRHKGQIRHQQPAYYGGPPPGQQWAPPAGQYPPGQYPQGQYPQGQYPPAQSGQPGQSWPTSQQAPSEQAPPQPAPPQPAPPQPGPPQPAPPQPPQPGDDPPTQS